MFVPSENIRPYIILDFSYEARESGNLVVAKPDLPERLKNEYEEFKKEIESFVKKNPYADL